MNTRFYKFLLLLILFSCNKKEVLERYQSGQVKLECQMNGETRDGKCTWYYPNGAVESIVTYNNGQIDGKATFFHSNGEINWISYFENGNKNGVIDYFDSTGVKYQTSTFKNNSLHGSSLAYFSNGDTARFMNYSHGKLDGLFKSFHSNGKLQMKTIYKNGQVVDFTEYDQSGNVIDKFIQYSIIKIDSNIYEVVLENPMHDLMGLEILVPIGEDSLDVFERATSLTNRIRYKIQEPLSTTEFYGNIFELDTIENEEGIVKRTRRIYHEYN